MLTREVVAMQTKLRRIEALINQRAKYGEGDGVIVDVQADLRHECDSLKVQNEAAREKVKKLKIIERGLATRPAGAPSKVDKFAHV
jgi:DNA-binding protein YbaB